jgi:cobalt-zinc-cadmium efflux system outer membrane protein
MFDDHPSAAAARANVEAAALKHRRTRLEPYPDVSVGLAGGRYGDSGESFVEVGLSVPLPLLDRGKGNEREARANLNVAEAELEAIRHDLEREWQIAQTRHRTAVTQVTTQRERLLPKANEALDLVRTGFEEGKFSFIDLVDTQRMAAEARLAYLKKLLEMNIAEAELEALLRPQKIQSSTDR